MDYQLNRVTWELTNACNLRCKHCGSVCGEAVTGELTTQEALSVCGQIAELNANRVVLIGGEILMRGDWDVIASRLCELGITVGTVSNGLMIDNDIASRLEQSGITSIGISIDGTQAYHDSIRSKGCYAKAVDTIALLRNRNINLSVITVVLRDNLSQLEEIKGELVRHGVRAWQIQLGIPMGNLSNRCDWVIDPKDIETVIDFAYKENLKGDIYVLLPDGVGYYTKKEAISRGIYLQSDALPVWGGCKAGITSVGILSNGDIVGCTTMHDPYFVEGNVHSRSLTDVWNDENCFKWNRNFQTHHMEGFCGTCPFVKRCRGGCTSFKYNTGGSVYSENRYCAYHSLYSTLETPAHR